MFILNSVNDLSFSFTMHSILIERSVTIERFFTTHQERMDVLANEFTHFLVNETLAWAGHLKELQPDNTTVDIGYRSALNFFEFASMRRKNDRLRMAPVPISLQEWRKLRTYLKAMLPPEADKRAHYAAILRNLNEVNDLILDELENGTHISISSLKQSA